MKYFRLVFSLWALLASAYLFAQQPLVLQLPDTIVPGNDTLRLNITARQFSGIVSMQFSMKWDTSVMRYASFETADLPFVAIGSSAAKNGVLRFSWFDIEGKGQTLADGRSIIRLKFFVHGRAGSTTEVTFTNTPLEIQVFRAVSGSATNQEVPLNAQNGRVTIAGGTGILQTSFGVTNVRCTNGSDGAINATILNAPAGSTVRWTGPNNFQSQQEDIANLKAGTYKFSVFNSAGASLLDTTFIVQQPALALALERIVTDSTGCQPSGKATITAKGGTTPYTYNIGSTFVNTNQFTNLAAGSYSLTVRDANSCTVSDTFRIAASKGTVVIDTVITSVAGCTQSTGSATVTAVGGRSPYSYSINNNFVNTNQFSNLAAGRYTVTVRDANNCTTSDTFSIRTSNPPQVELGDTVFVCQGENTMLDAGVQTTYRWSNGATTRSISVAMPGIYKVTVTNAAGCSASDSVRVQAGNTFDLKIENDTLAICPQKSLQLRASAAETYRWIDTSKTLSKLDIANPISKPRFTSRYTVIASNGCNADTASVEVQVLKTEATAGPDTCVAPGTSLELYASGGDAYFWFLSEYSVSNPRIPNPTTEPKDSTSYYVMITDINGCQILDTIDVMVANNPLDIKAVNMITPNGDGKNDVLEFSSLAKYGLNTLKVYNRWGDLVYQKIDYQKDEERFDGTRNGKPLPAGNYFYVLSFKTGDVKQTLTILRN